MAKKEHLKPGSKDGRPLKLTPKLQAEIITYIENGAYVETAAAGAGVNKVTFYDWLKKGKKEDNGIYRDFSNAIRKAMASSELRDINTISTASLTNWQAAAWKLERKFPDRWGRKDRNETVVTVKPYVIESPDGKAVIKLGADKEEIGELDPQAIAASEKSYYDIELINQEDDKDVFAKDQQDE